MSRAVSHQQRIRELEAELQRLKNEEASTAAVQPITQSNFDLSSSPNLANHAHDGRRHSTPRTAARVHGLNLQTAGLPNRNFAHPPPMKRSRTTSAQESARTTSTKMGRSSSSMSTMSGPAIPFTGSGPITPPISHSPSHPTGSALVEFYCQDQQHMPGSEMLFNHAAQSMASMPYPSPMIPQTGGGLMEVSQFLEAKGQPVVPPTPSSATRQFLSPDDAYQFSLPAAIPSSCGSLTEAATAETPMSRSNSNMFGDATSLSGPMGMARIESQSSQHTDGLSSQDSRNYYRMMTHCGSQLKRPSEEDVFGIGGGLTAAVPSAQDMSLLPHMERTDSSNSDDSNESAPGFGYPDPIAFQTQQYSVSMERSTSGISTNSSHSHDQVAWGNRPFLPQHISAAPMERSESSQSAKSNHSLKLRAKEALSRQNNNANKAPILQPKPPSTKPEGNSSQPAGGKSSNKKEITKHAYQRPKRPKIKCTQCQDYPDGFRGEHELRRHTEAKHKGRVKKFICQDPHKAGLETKLEAVNPLDQCKQCSASKQYGAYYNAAAHLRRTHFKKKPARGSKKNGNPENPEEKRGGKGGGDWPPMPELKLWMKEIYVSMEDPGAFANDAYEIDENQAEIAFVDQTSATAQMFEGIGCNFSDTVDYGHAPTFSNMADFQNDNLDTSTYSMATGSAGFHYDPHNHSITLDNNYPSPVESSTATVTANMFAAEQQYCGSPSTSPMMMTSEHQYDMSFDMSFTTAV